MKAFCGFVYYFDLFADGVGATVQREPGALEDRSGRQSHGANSHESGGTALHQVASCAWF